jgi:hypothetical protein
MAAILTANNMTKRFGGLMAVDTLDVALSLIVLPGFISLKLGRSYLTTIPWWDCSRTGSFRWASLGHIKIYVSFPT